MLFIELLLIFSSEGFKLTDQPLKQPIYRIAKSLSHRPLDAFFERKYLSKH